MMSACSTVCFPTATHFRIIAFPTPKTPATVVSQGVFAYYTHEHKMALKITKSLLFFRSYKNKNTFVQTANSSPLCAVILLPIMSYKNILPSLVMY